VLTLFFIWCLLAVVVLSLAGYRKLVARREDDLVHLGDSDAVLVDSQKSLAERLSSIDKWGKALTFVTLILGLVIASVYLYQGWIESSQKVHI